MKSMICCFAAMGLAAGVWATELKNDAEFAMRETPKETPDVDSWHGANLLGLFNAVPQKPDPRIRGKFEECYFRWFKEWGFNFARLPMDYRFFLATNDWSRLKLEGFEEVDRAVAWGRKYGVHVQLAIHRAPGYTVCYWDPEKGRLQSDPEPQAAFIRIWSEFARRYRGIPNSELSFNLVNEPTGFTEAQFIDVFGRTIDAIRAVDPGRFVMLDGNDCASTPVAHFYKVPLTGQAFRGYTPHAISHYLAWYVADQPETEPTWPFSGEMAKRDGWNYERPEVTLGKFAGARDSGYPVMIGEFGCYNKLKHETCLAWMEDCLKLWNARGLGWAIWNVDGAFGFMDSDRADVEYEDFEGHKLDRKMLDLLRKYCGTATGPAAGVWATELKNDAEFTMENVPAEAQAELPKGGSIRFLLEENATTGYEWTAAYSTNEVEVVVEHRGPLVEKGLCGAPGVAAVRANLKGNDAAPVFIEMKYARAWEKGPAAKTMRIALYKAKDGISLGK